MHIHPSENIVVLTNGTYMTYIWMKYKYLQLLNNRPSVRYHCACLLEFHICFHKINIFLQNKTSFVFVTGDYLSCNNNSSRFIVPMFALTNFPNLYTAIKHVYKIMYICSPTRNNHPHGPDVQLKWLHNLDNSRQRCSLNDGQIKSPGWITFVKVINERYATCVKVQ